MATQHIVPSDHCPLLNFWPPPRLFRTWNDLLFAYFSLPFLLLCLIRWLHPGACTERFLLHQRGDGSPVQVAARQAEHESRGAPWTCGGIELAPPFQLQCGPRRSRAEARHRFVGPQFGAVIRIRGGENNFYSTGRRWFTKFRDDSAEERKFH